MRHRFRGRIAGVGSASGIRVVVGRWDASPLGAFADVMVETSKGHRVLLAPRSEVAEFVEATYTFDEVRLEPVDVVVEGARWEVRTPSLTLDLTAGPLTLLGRLLRLLPRGVATHPMWCRLVDPLARRVLRGVRTHGVARAGRHEYYGATDVRAVLSLSGRFDGVDLGDLRRVEPPCGFGFSSTPARPSVTALVTTVKDTDSADRLVEPITADRTDDFGTGGRS